MAITNKLRGIYIMKNILIILTAGIFVFFFSSQLSAESGKEIGFMMEEAIKHAEEAKTHKEHAKHVKKHAKLSLKSIKKAEIEAIKHEDPEGRPHMTAAIKNLVEAIKQAKMGRALIATEYVTIALEEMYQFKAE